MPVITVQMWSGRSAEQKAAIAEAITSAMVEIAGNTREKVNVIFHDVDQENWAIGGSLSVDRPHGATPPNSKPAADSQTKIAHAALRFEDLDAAEEFYVDTLGFGVRSKEKYRDGQPAIITQVGVGLVAGRSSPNVLDHIAFYVPSLSDALSLIEEKGLTKVRGPQEMPYGRSVYIEDPQGTEVELIEVDKEPGT